MKIKKMEDFVHDVEVTKEVLSSMPINNQKNLKAYKVKVSKVKEEYIDLKNELYQEIKKRSNKYLNISPNERIATLEKELEGLKDLSLFNPLNTPFEKLEINNALYRLNHFFKNDLEKVNKDIKYIIDLFTNVGVDITSDAFVYSYYAREYIKELLLDDSLDRMKYIFEELHWKCPDVIMHVSMNIRLLYNKHKSKFEEYIAKKKKEVFVDSLSYEDMVIKRDNILKELYDLKHYDKYSIVNGFMNSELILNDYSVVNVDKCYAKYFADNITSAEKKNAIGDLKNLLANVQEYNNFLKYTFILDDIKKKYSDKANHVGEVTTITKEIDTLASDLIKINNEINNGSSKGFWIFKKKVDVEKLYVDLNTKMKELNDKFDQYDASLVYEEMNKSLTDTSSIYEVFQFALSFKTYLRNCIKASKEESSIDIVKQLVGEFDEFISSNNVNVIRNSKFNYDNDLAEVISDHYQLLNIKITKDLLDEGNLESLIKDLKILINSYYLEDMGLNIDLINNLFDSKKIVSKDEA